ncbi:MAG: hypothetical protein AAB691_04520 [Patescibacteria group bacterium]
MKNPLLLQQLLFSYETFIPPRHSANYALSDFVLLARKSFVS